MKKVFALICFVVLSVSISFAQQSTMVFESEVFDFGTIKEEDGKVSCTFNFTNNGNEPFVIENISVSCGCTSPEYSKKPVMPGQSKELKITFDPTGRPGQFLKEIYLSSHSDKNKNTVKITGEVIPRPRTLVDDYPIELTSQLRISNINLGFMYVPRGKRVTMEVDVRNFGKKKASFEAKTDAKYLQLSPGFTLGAGEIGTLSVSYDVDKDADYGVLSDRVSLGVNGVEQGFSLSTTAYVIDDFSTPGAKSAKANFSSQYLSLGSLNVGEESERMVRVKNEGDNDLIIRYIKLPNGVKSSLKEGDIVKVGESAEVSFIFTATEPERYKESVVIVVNDAARPMREIRLFATVNAKQTY
ncbi:MAG: DUF1573 domain-containing protein [Rikenellaceae bacterium]